MSGAALIAFVRDCHKDCGGCPVEQMCDEYELTLNGNAVLLTAEQSTEVSIFLGRIVTHPAIFGPAHEIHDAAYVFMPWFATTPPEGAA